MQNTSLGSVLWVSPNLNHYKKRALSHLAGRGKFSFTVIRGQARGKMGHEKDASTPPFSTIDIPVSRQNFAISPRVFVGLLKHIRQQRPDIVLMPIERKLLPLIVWLKCLQPIFGFKLVSYNHPALRAQRTEITPADLSRTRKYFKRYDQIIFYTEQARNWAVDNQLLPAPKAYFANNTIDTDAVKTASLTQPTDLNPPKLLFIGRLVPSKRLDLLLKYYNGLKTQFTQTHLTIIGAGPEADKLTTSTKADPNVQALGAIIDEAEIAGHMNQANLVFIPGESGLSIAHAFAYGKPYATLNLPSSRHGPEISYLKGGENGLLLSGDLGADMTTLKAFFSDATRYAKVCENAKMSGQALSIHNWCAQIEAAFVDVLHKHP